MHMADALLSPEVGLTFCGLSAAGIAYAAHRIAKEPDDGRTPLMGVLGAFVFAGQMVNFSIPGTGSSGHIGGGMLLTILLGPWRALVAIASVLIVQCLFFADGGLLALGANIVNMGLWPALVGSSLYWVIAGRPATRIRLAVATIVCTALALELGAFGVVVETTLSGRSELPFGPFAAIMLGIHLPIGLVEGLLTVAVVSYVYQVRPSLLESTPGTPRAPGAMGLKPVVGSLLVATAVTAGVISCLASAQPDGLEFSIGRVYQDAELEPGELPAPSTGVHRAAAGVQRTTALLPDYALPAGSEPAPPAEVEDDQAGGGIDVGTSIAGLTGSGVLLLLLAGLAWLTTRWRAARRA